MQLPSFGNGVRKLTTSLKKVKTVKCIVDRVMLLIQ